MTFVDSAVPPLPELEIKESTRQHIDQQNVDRALAIIYRHSPALFAQIADREKRNVGIADIAPALDAIIREEVRKEVTLKSLTALARIKFEARRRARVMYGMPPFSEVDPATGAPQKSN